MAFDRALVLNLNLTQLLDFIIGWQFKKNVSIVLGENANDIVALELNTLGELYMLDILCLDG